MCCLIHVLYVQEQYSVEKFALHCVRLILWEMHFAKINLILYLGRLKILWTQGILCPVSLLIWRRKVHHPYRFVLSLTNQQEGKSVFSQWGMENSTEALRYEYHLSPYCMHLLRICPQNVILLCSKLHKYMQFASFIGNNYSTEFLQNKNNYIGLKAEKQSWAALYIMSKMHGWS